ncbi:MAG: Aminopeptidase YpdF (MP-, MA-, MS-, AP-, NP-specific) [uncultured Thermomicrobiales bacterium]|uniref:Aminopeptidase YpdF (MP-, MA-, MS-, AP-, NP-specific) n=1 Tax=uncultured Thermomicrobiales bacterium TaxID=1645740 RepID=A0A6J4V5S4_9BACT|nr:MAG: Aminopeptidase YpdF (MP-, MA-, MS-, AP-, NP-specific) [uncultured Thermomicrobiales bacterium]
MVTDAGTATTQTPDLFVYRERLERAQAEMGQQGVDLLLVGPSSDFRYLTGHDAHTSERLTLLLLPRDGDPSVVVPTLEAPQFVSRRDLLNVHPWEETQAPTDLVATLAGDLTGKTVAVGDQLYSVFLLRLQAAMPGVQWVSATPTLRALRMTKDGREIEALREAARRTDDAWEEFVSKPLAGQTETEALGRLRALTADRGLKGVWGICASGPNSASPHHHTGDRVIREGDAVIFDWGGTIEGYYSDVTRTVHVGEPDEEFRRVYDLVLRANQVTLDAVGPGVPCEALDEAARDLITGEGYGAAFLHRVGHGLGLDVHEEPYLVGGNALPLETGMVFSDEPGVYLEGRFGVRIEDAVLCTEDGGERLNEATRELLILG